MLEHFIVLFLNGTCVALNQLELESTAMAIQHNYTQRVETKIETLQYNYKDQVYNDNLTVTVTLY